MSDFRAVPIISDQQALRVNPLASQASSAPVAKAAPAGVGASGVQQFSPQSGTSPDINGDGELDEDEVAALQTAAEQGDGEALDFLKQLGLPLLGGAAALAGGYGAVRGGLALTDALSRNRGGGAGLFGDQARTAGPVDSVNMRPQEQDPFIRQAPKVLGADPAQGLLPAPQAAVGQVPQQRLPAPNRAITDQSGTRFNQGVDPARQEQKLLPDLNKINREVEAAYAQKAAQDAARAEEVRLRGNLGQSVGMKLKGAARAARRIR